MTPSIWIALAAICLSVIGAAVYIGRVIGSLPGLIAGAVRVHEEKCLNYEKHSAVNIRAVDAGP